MSHLLSSDDEREAELEDDPEEEEDENSNIAYVVQWTLNWVDLIYHINHDGICCKIDLTSQWLDILCSFNVI